MKYDCTYLMHWTPSLCYVLHTLKCFYNSLCSTNYILLKKVHGIPFVDQMLYLMTWKLWLSALPSVSLWSGSKGWRCFGARLEYGPWKTQGRRWVALKECLRDILEDGVFHVSSRQCLQDIEKMASSGSKAWNMLLGSLGSWGSSNVRCGSLWKGTDESSTMWQKEEGSGDTAGLVKD